jgi:MFS superfamily sulfate permease-like transporter
MDGPDISGPKKAQPIEKPQNGLAGLKHWRHDIVAGLLVSLISLPFSLGIAVASGAPPVSGLISAIIAGLVLPFLGGSYVTISGPAAGLAPVLLVSMAALGRGNLTVGYPLLLAVICMAGCVQIVLSWLRAARFSAVFPATVVEAMLASIGLLIIIKQLPHLVGHPFKAHEFWGIVAETPSQFGTMVPKVFIFGLACLALIFALSALKARWLKVVPPQVIVVFLAIVAGRLVGIEGRYLIDIPDKPFSHGIVLPNFRGLMADQSLWLTALTAVITLTLIDGVESLATIAAIDKIDPFKRKSDPNRTLFAMGVSNICSSAAGGLTIIPGGVKSTANIIGGGRTQWANFYNALFLIGFLLFGRNLINMIPLSALAAVLIFTGYKLCRPAVWRHVAHIGTEQFALFTITVLTTLATDLLWGIGVGIAAQLLMNAWFAHRSARRAAGLPAPVVAAAIPTPRRVAELFGNPVRHRETADGAYHLHFGGPVVCFNALHVNDELARIPDGIEAVYLHMTEEVTLVDHTSCDNLTHFAEEFAQGGKVRVEILGLDGMHRVSEAATCMRMRTAPPTRDAASPEPSQPEAADVAAWEQATSPVGVPSAAVATASLPAMHHDHRP